MGESARGTPDQKSLVSVPRQLLREIGPALRISNLTGLITIQRSEDFARWAEGLRKAGLPE